VVVEVNSGPVCIPICWAFDRAIEPPPVVVPVTREPEVIAVVWAAKSLTGAVNVDFDVESPVDVDVEVVFASGFIIKTPNDPLRTPD
jgi:hypothetical protein